jgi:catechol 2,3-dioxygenase-like lactoylglutathione lyase family enzyme
MPLLALDHVNLTTTRLAEMCRFYEEVLGFARGPRPAFSFDGAWLYCGEHPAVHLVVVEAARRPSPEASLQHFAFRATGLGDFLEGVARFGSVPRLGFLRDFGICQVNLIDPEGNRLHVDFPLGEAEALGLAGATEQGQR